ncbi:SMI1/KNR4 family protein [Kitasatospora sp. A2-31]|uniref:SMI1/KNR4 family protein n=1 Tax=Kitasatospora sp. A2-31 TaxID=2916414 RepID=UPI001EED3D83|nr:SMI1/KNR4 family protein [Kitasatospora sp. A2-31]MCG6499992.1 SMI1/KNR4 family protein [Kitasatospora sp. A2-31]MCG6499995.1 SMI1/KNR4 family protein [Kitasatospora sp. A2-31]
MSAIRELLSCIGPTCGDSVDWGAAEKLYGKPFPGDYQAFAAAFGGGSIEQVVGIRMPAVTPDELHGNTVSRISEAALADEAVNRWRPSEQGRHRLEDLLIWGETAAADTLCWITADPDPDRWPVAVYSRGNLEWSVYSCGMAEFLLKLLRNEWQPWPISDASLQDMADPRFLHDKDEAAGWESGSDPWE